jgi:acyl-coenzyme A synthetase/AMP-(fatty) acid ligase/3-hydroxymyristoyl/3-hydroxydecanoyl-(acyl carrier protein) dehydratase
MPPPPAITTDMLEMTPPALDGAPVAEQKFPLLFHTSAQQIIAYRDGRPGTVGEFLQDVADVARWLPVGGHVFNVCADRYLFTVGLCATLLAGKISLLPSTHTPEMVRQLASFAPDAFCLHDSEKSGIALPSWRMPLLQPRAERAVVPDNPMRMAPDGIARTAAETLTESTAETSLCIPEIEAARVMAYVFTSGSTGLPVPHRKTWGFLVRNIRAAAQRLELAGEAAAQPVTLIGTVPPQHMYGFESTVLLALLGGLAFSNRQPFYPHDIRAELDLIPGSRILVTSPVHLRALLQSSPQVPAATMLLSATAPLAHKLAVEAETAFAAPLIEIYGSTETGQIATRRTARTDAWQLFPEVRLVAAPDSVAAGLGQAAATATAADEADVFWVSGGHVEQPVPMGDVLEEIDATHFRLLGRRADMINIAGKRSSLAYLNHQLNAIDGVLDGAFHMPDTPASPTDAKSAEPAVIRLVAFAVAPHRSLAEVLRELRQRIDIVFMPRPLCLIGTLPRNGTGKITHEMLERLHAQHVLRIPAAPETSAASPAAAAADTSADLPASIAFTIAAHHPARAGHFPGQPIVPGVMLLDHALSLLGEATGNSFEVCQIASAKFPSPASFGEPMKISYRVLAGGALRFSVEQGASVVASGTLAQSR